MKSLLVACLCLWVSACVTFKAISVDKKTSLEEQFIGEYEELTDDLSSIASERETAEDPGPRGDDPHARALQARRIQAFYADDLERLRAQGCVGEALDGHVQALKCQDEGGAAGSQATHSQMSRVVASENVARDALVAYALSAQPNLKESDKQRVWQAFRKVITQNLKPGALMQDASGKWVRR